MHADTWTDRIKMADLITRRVQLQTRVQFTMVDKRTDNMDSGRKRPEGSRGGSPV